MSSMLWRFIDKTPLHGLFLYDIPFICWSCICRDNRLGKSGIADIVSHKFFSNDSWTWETIRDSVPPVIPDISSDTDTSNFDEIEDDRSMEETFPVPKAYAGNHLPFIGFTFNREYRWGTGNNHPLIQTWRCVYNSEAMVNLWYTCSFLSGGLPNRGEIAADTPSRLPMYDEVRQVLNENCSCSLLIIQFSPLLLSVIPLTHYYILYRVWPQNVDTLHHNLA